MTLFETLRFCLTLVSHEQQCDLAYRNYSTRLLTISRQFWMFFEKGTFPSSSITLISSPFLKKMDGNPSELLNINPLSYSIKLFPSTAFLFFFPQQTWPHMLQRKQKSSYSCQQIANPTGIYSIFFILLPKVISLHMLSIPLCLLTSHSLFSHFQSCLGSHHSLKWDS